MMKIDVNFFLKLAKISYDIADGFEVQLGANVFVGEEGNFGQYNENDMVFMKVRCDF